MAPAAASILGRVAPSAVPFLLQGRCCTAGDDGLRAEGLWPRARQIASTSRLRGDDAVLCVGAIAGGLWRPLSPAVIGGGESLAPARCPLGHPNTDSTGRHPQAR